MYTPSTVRTQNISLPPRGFLTPLALTPSFTASPRQALKLLLNTLGRCAFSRMSHNEIIWVSYDFWSYLHFIIPCSLLGHLLLKECRTHKESVWCIHLHCARGLARSGCSHELLLSKSGNTRTSGGVPGEGALGVGETLSVSSKPREQGACRHKIVFLHVPVSGV